MIMVVTLMMLMLMMLMMRMLLMMTMMMMRMRMMMRRRMLRRKTDPKTGTHTLCEPAQSKRMSRFHKSHFIQKFTGKMLRPE